MLIRQAEFDDESLDRGIFRGIFRTAQLAFSLFAALRVLHLDL